jgi:hypothetical protein
MLRMMGGSPDGHTDAHASHKDRKDDRDGPGPGTHPAHRRA